MNAAKAEKTFSSVDFDRLVHDFMTTGDFAVMRVIEDCVGERLTPFDAEMALNLIVPLPSQSERMSLRRHACGTDADRQHIVIVRGNDEPRFGKWWGGSSQVIVGRDWLVGWRMRNRPQVIEFSSRDGYQPTIAKMLYAAQRSDHDLEAACECATSCFWIKKWFKAASYQCDPEVLTTFTNADQKDTLARSIHGSLLLIYGKSLPRIICHALGCRREVRSHESFCDRHCLVNVELKKKYRARE